MTKLPVRLTLLFLSVAAVGYAAFFFWSSEQHLRLTDNSSRRFETTARAVSVGVVELRAAQQAYVAAGQGEDFWFARVTAIVKDLDDRLSTLESGATVAEAVAAVDDAAGVLQDFGQMDRRARAYTHGRQLTLASDLVFTDGFDLTRKAGDAIERAITAELTARDAVAGDVRRDEVRALAGAAGGAPPRGLFLLPPRRQAPAPAQRSTPPPPPPRAAGRTPPVCTLGVAA